MSHGALQACSSQILHTLTNQSLGLFGQFNFG